MAESSADCSKIVKDYRKSELKVELNDEDYQSKKMQSQDKCKVRLKKRRLHLHNSAYERGSTQG